PTRYWSSDVCSSDLGIIQTVAGNGTKGGGGDGGPATSAQLNGPFDVAVDGSGNVFIADSGNQRIREVVASTGTIQTVAGNGAQRSEERRVGDVERAG